MRYAGSLHEHDSWRSSDRSVRHALIRGDPEPVKEDMEIDQDHLFPWRSDHPHSFSSWRFLSSADLPMVPLDSRDLARDSVC